MLVFRNYYQNLFSPFLNTITMIGPGVFIGYPVGKLCTEKTTSNEVFAGTSITNGELNEFLFLEIGLLPKFMS